MREQEVPLRRAVRSTPRTCHIARYASMRSTSSGSSPSDVAAARASTRPSRTSLPSASPLLCVPEPALLPGCGRKARLVVRLCLLERPHERSDVAAVPRQGTHVDLAKAAPGDPAGLPHDPVHMIRRAGGSEGAELADKHYADVRDVPEAPSRQRPVDRHQGGAVARPPLVVLVPRAPQARHARAARRHRPAKRDGRGRGAGAPQEPRAHRAAGGPRRQVPRGARHEARARRPPRTQAGGGQGLARGTPGQVRDGARADPRFVARHHRGLLRQDGQADAAPHPRGIPGRAGGAHRAVSQGDRREPRASQVEVGGRTQRRRQGGCGVI